MNIAISGASGYIGKSIKSYLNNKYHFIDVPREKLDDEPALKLILEKADVFIILNGYPIIKRWTPQNKKKIIESRVDVVKKVSNCVEKFSISIEAVISASAVGAYNNYDFNTELSTTDNKVFISQLIKDWESSMNADVRKIHLRLGVVVGKRSAYIQKLKLNLKTGINVLFGKAHEPIAVIHIQHLIQIIDFIINNKRVEGIVNCVEPTVYSQYTLMKFFRKNNISFVVPAFLLKLAFGRAGQMLYEGQKVIPEKLLKNGFKFDTVDLKGIFAN